MACSIELKTTTFLKEEQIIDGENNIIDPSLFAEYNHQLSILALNKYGVGGTGLALFKREGGKAVPNSKLFELLEESTFSHEMEKIFVRSKGINDTIDEKTKDDIISEEFHEVEEEELDAFQLKKVDLTTTSQKLEYTLARLQQSIRENIKRNRQITANKSLDESVISATESRIEILNNLYAQIEKSREANSAKGIVDFVIQMQSAVNYINAVLAKVDVKEKKHIALMLNSYDNFLMSFSVVDDVRELIADFKRTNSEEFLTNTELEKLVNDLSKADGQFNATKTLMYDVKKEFLKNNLTDIKYFPKILYKHRQRLSKEFDQLKRPGTKEEYINKSMAPNGRDWQLIQADVEQAVKELFENPIFDVNLADNWFTSTSNISNELIQIFHRKLIEIDNERIRTEREDDVKELKIHDDLRKEKGTIGLNSLYGNILETDSNGKKHLKGEYNSNFLIEVRDKIRQIVKEEKKIIDELFEKAQIVKKLEGATSTAYLNAQQEIAKKKKNLDNRVEAILEANVIRDVEGKIISPKAKWKNNLSGLSPAEKAAIEHYKSIIDQGHKVNARESLKTYGYGAFFYELPKITKSGLERTYAGDIKGALKEQWDYLSKTRADDIEYTNESVDLSGKTIRELKMHYRDRYGVFDNKSQSIDLANIFRLERKNVNIFKLRREREMEFSFLIDIAKNQKFYQRNGNLLQRALNKEKLHINTNENSNLVQNLKNMMDYRFYDISIKNNKKWGPVDANKATNYVNGLTAFMALSFNFASGTANVVNAQAQMFLETVFKGHTFTAANVAKANKIYWTPSVITDTMRDVTRGINRSYINQLSEMFNIRGLRHLSESNFLQASLLRKGADLKSFQVFQDSGEHWIQSVLMMSVLDNIKVMNENSEFIDKDGKVVKKIKDAASLLDMYKVDKETGLVDLDTRVVYTTHSPSSAWNEGGKELVDILIRKKLDDNIGNYTQTQQADGYRHWLFKMGMLFRKYLVPMGQARLLGIENAFVPKGKLREDQNRFSHALQQYEEGTYTTFLRYGWNSIKNLKNEIATRENWSNLSEYEKHNIKRAAVELALTWGILPQLIRLLAMGAAADDDPEEWYYAMYQVRRNITELASYRNPGEMFKMLKSPIPSMRFLEGTMGLMKQSLPQNWFEEDSKGQNLWLKHLNRFNPMRQFNKDFEQTFRYQDNTFMMQ